MAEKKAKRQTATKRIEGLEKRLKELTAAVAALLVIVLLLTAYSWWFVATAIEDVDEKVESLFRSNYDRIEEVKQRVGDMAGIMRDGFVVLNDRLERVEHGEPHRHNETG